MLDKRARIKYSSLLFVSADSNSNPLFAAKGKEEKMRTKYIRKVALVAVFLLMMPLLMATHPSVQDTHIHTQTQQRVIQETYRHGARFVEFEDTVRFFASNYGCRSGEETAYIVRVIDRRRGLIRTGFCVADGENGAIRPAPMRPIAGSYQIDNDAELQRQEQAPGNPAESDEVSYNRPCLLKDQTRCVDYGLAKAQIHGLNPRNSFDA